MTEPREFLPNRHYYNRRLALDGRCVIADEDDVNAFMYCVGAAQLANPGIELNGLVTYKCGYDLEHFDHGYETPGQHGPVWSPSTPNFLRDLNRLYAQYKNARLGRTGSPLWHPGSYDNTTLEDAETARECLADLAYLPVSAGLAPDLNRYPGWVTRPDHVGKTFEFQKPDGVHFAWFAKEFQPDAVEVTFSPIVDPCTARSPSTSNADDETVAASHREADGGVPALPEVGLADHRRDLVDRIAAREAADTTRDDRDYVGRSALKELKFHDILPTQDMSDLHVKCMHERNGGDRQSVYSVDPEVREDARQRRGRFLRYYHEAFEVQLKHKQWEEWDDAAFPEGTYLYRSRLHVELFPNVPPG